MVTERDAFCIFLMMVVMLYEDERVEVATCIGMRWIAHLTFMLLTLSIIFSYKSVAALVSILILEIHILFKDYLILSPSSGVRFWKKEHWYQICEGLYHTFVSFRHPFQTHFVYLRHLVCFSWGEQEREKENWSLQLLSIVAFLWVKLKSCLERI